MFKRLFGSSQPNQSKEQEPQMSNNPMNQSLQREDFAKRLQEAQDLQAKSLKLEQKQGLHLDKIDEIEDDPNLSTFQKNLGVSIVDEEMSMDNIVADMGKDQVRDLGFGDM